jgi:alpha-mannosidase
VVTHYKFPKNGGFIDVNIRLHWNEKQKMVKMLIPCDMENTVCEGETAFGLEKLPQTGRENVSQRHLTMSDEKHSVCIINNCVYGSSCEGPNLKITLIRSPGYTAHPIGDRDILPQDRYTPHCDLGEHEYGFRLFLGERKSVSDKRGIMAALFNQKPYALSFFPPGNGAIPETLIRVSPDTVEMTCLKNTDKGLFIRLFNPTAEIQTSSVETVHRGDRTMICLKPGEVVTRCIDI